VKKWNHEQCPLYIRLYIFLKSECNIRHPHSGASKWGLDIAGFQPIHTQSHLGFPLPTMKPTYWSHQTRLGTGNSSLKIFPTAVRYCGSCCARKLRVELSLGVPRPPQGGGKHRHQCWNKTNKWSWQWYGHRLWVSMLWSFTTMGKEMIIESFPNGLPRGPFPWLPTPWWYNWMSFPSWSRLAEGTLKAIPLWQETFVLPTRRRQESSGAGWPMSTLGHGGKASKKSMGQDRWFSGNIPINTTCLYGN
jgi:hypothetical protein